MLLETDHAVFGYGGRPVVRADSLRLHAGRCLGIFGPNGAGKTTLVRGIIGALTPMAGIIERRKDLTFGYLPQHRSLDLHWPMTGFDAAAMAVSARCRFGMLGTRDKSVREAMRSLDVLDLRDSPFARLSGGQRQRLLLAGALATRPDLLVLDEPTDGLDLRSRQALLDRLHAQKSAGLCTVMISHDVQDLLELADEIAWLVPGDEPQTPSQTRLILPGEFADRVVHIGVVNR